MTEPASAVLSWCRVRNQVGPVVEGDVGLVRQRPGDVLVVGLAVLSLDGEGRNPVRQHGRRHVVLGAQGIGGAQRQLSAPGLERGGQVGGLGGDVQAAGYPGARQRLLPGEPLPYQLKHGHLARCPLDPQPPLRGERHVLDVTADGLLRAHAYLLSMAGILRAPSLRATESLQGASERPRVPIMTRIIAGFRALSLASRSAFFCRRRSSRKRQGFHITMADLETRPLFWSSKAWLMSSRRYDFDSIFS